MISIIVACDKNNLIGKKDSVLGMPWSNKEDLKHFKETTLNHSVVFGMNTFKAMGERALPKRDTIIITRSDYKNDKVKVRNNLEEVIKEYKENNKQLYICGGAQIYKQSLKYADEILLSRIPGDYVGETYFPSYSQFKLDKTIEFETFTLEIYRKN